LARTCLSALLYLQVSYESLEYVELPQVTVCNWNQRGLGQTVCEQCGITLLQCDQLDEFGGPNTNCLSKWNFTEIVVDNYGTFNCYQFNSNKNVIMVTNNTGWDDAIVSVFGVSPVPPPPADMVWRSGLLVSFDLPGVKPDLYNAAHEAPTGYDTFFAMREIRQSRLENGVEHITQRSYAIQNYLVQLPFDVANGTGTMASDSFPPTLNCIAPAELVGVSFSMETLQRENIRAAPTYRLSNWWADFSALLGAILGLDLVKIASSLIIFVAAWRKQRIAHLREHFM